MYITTFVVINPNLHLQNPDPALGGYDVSIMPLYSCIRRNFNKHAHPCSASRSMHM